MTATFDPTVTGVDSVMFGGMATPGVAKVTGLTKPKRLDEQAGPGLTGGYLIFRGMKLARFNVEIDLYKPEHFTDWELFLAFIREPKNPIPMAQMVFDVWHPILAQRQISSATIEDAKGPEQQGDDSRHRVVLNCIEHRTPKLQSSKPDQPEERPKDWADREIDAKRIEAERLRNVSNWGGFWK